MTVVEPLLSIITIADRDVNELEATRASIESQTFLDWEHIVVVPHYREQLKDAARSWTPKPIVVQDQGEGVFVAMNQGVAATSGSYLNFLNGGDCYSDPQVLDTIASILVSAPPWLLAGWETPGPPVRRHLPRGLTASHWRLKYFLQAQSHQSTFISRDFFQCVGPYDRRFPVVADYEWSLRASRLVEAELAPVVAVTVQPGGMSQVEPWKTACDSHRARVSISVTAVQYGVSCCVALLHWLRWRLSDACASIRAAPLTPT